MLCQLSYRPCASRIPPSSVSTAAPATGIRQAASLAPVHARDRPARRGERPRPGSHRDDDLALRMPRLEVLEGGERLVEGKRAVDDGAQHALAHE